ncbi:hypothetical protein ABPG72_020672 [Tetrahymena utriculariae]
MATTTNILHDVVRDQSMVNYVSNRDRPLYFKRPLVPQMTDIPLHISRPPIDQQVDYQSMQMQQNATIVEAPTKDAFVQTDYRESETQTDPFTPKCFVRDGDHPEVMELKDYKYGKGLPASIEELEQIELNREKVWFENSLPPISDEASFNLRRKLMKEQELREWSKKENEIKKFQNEKLYLLQQALIEREKEVEDKSQERIEEIRQQKTEHKNRQIAKIQRKKIKIDRKMTKSRKMQGKETLKRDIIEDYANFASRVYAGITHEGLSLDKIANKYEVQPLALGNYEMLQALHEGIRPREFETRVNLKKEIKEIEKNYTRLENYHRGELKKAQDEINGVHQQSKAQQQKKGNNFSYKDAENKIRPATPTWIYDANFNYSPSPISEIQVYRGPNGVQLMQAADKREEAVLLLQRLLRGRTTQNIMYEGKKKRTALIEELLTVAQIENLEEDKAEEVLMQQHEEKVKNAVLESIQGEVIAETMDELSKELLRIKQERKIQQMVEIAEKDRRIREIEEAGKRQAEEILRDREDVLHNQLIRVHQGTVDTYLDWLMSNALEQSSARQATIMTNLRKAKFNLPLEDFEKKYNNNQTLIKDLVHSFLIPNVQRSKLKKQIQLEEKRFSEAAKRSLQQTITRASNKHANVQN